jgi:hypothetical protein
LGFSEVALGAFAPLNGLQWMLSPQGRENRAMRFLYALAAGLAFLSPHLSGALARAQGTPAMGGLTSRTGWAALGIVQGRIKVLDVPPRSERSAACADREAQLSESLCVKGEGNATALRYEFASPEQRLTIQAGSDGRVEIHRVPLEEAVPVELHLIQAPGRDLVLTIGAGRERREISAPDFWRLMLAEPGVARDCLTPLLESLRSDWGLRRQAAEIEARMFELCDATPPPDTQRWQALVGQLGDSRFARREAADRELRAAGPSAAPFLAQLDLQQLDPEQRGRLKAIQHSLHGAGEDTPLRVAARLVNDHAAWLALLARDDADQRSAAARQLCKLCPEATTFDPQADRAVRGAQLHRLRQQLARD